jgi:Bacterial aa3 type cytochrome c oxidase subunit IV
MASNSSGYRHGEMDVSEQQATYHLVMGMTKWGSLALAAVILWLAVWFCTPAGFVPATISAVILLILGIALLRERSPAGH